jgi:carboxyl-terminal processing protease
VRGRHRDTLAVPILRLPVVQIVGFNLRADYYITTGCTERGQVKRVLGATTVLALLAVCGCGGGGSGGGNGAAPNPPAGWQAGVFSPASSFAALCVNPRSGINPGTNAPYPDRPGSRTDENNWLRSWSHDLYLWYREIVDRDPALYATAEYFDLLKTNAITASGKAKDAFHFSMPTDEWQRLAQSGVSAGYGATWAFLADTPPRDVRVAYTEPNSPATAMNILRGATVLAIDGIDVINESTQAGIDALNDGLYPAQPNETHDFTIRDPNGTQRTVTMTSVDLALTPVQHVQVLAGNVGYMLFNDHLATAEQALIQAVNQLAGVDDLVLDIRYNSGGYLAIASELAYMIAGSTRTAGRVFERAQFNDQHPNVDPVSGGSLTTPFYDTSVGLSAPAGQALPNLNLPRVYLLTGANTCSASESIINSLQGINVDVIQIGSTTCGKPYGFYPADNCGTTYFSVQFQGVNALGFGDYADGFSPANTQSDPGVPVTGCSVADDFDHQLGDAAELRLATALDYRVTLACPTPTGVVIPGAAAATLGVREPVVPKRPWLTNRIMRR